MTMQSIAEPLNTELIDSEADYVLYSPKDGVLSQHCTASEAAMAYYQAASKQSIGDRLPLIYRRHDDQWVPVN